MVAKRISNEPEKAKRPPAKTPQARENQLIALTLDLAEKQLREGTASSQLMTHFLKASSMRDELEKKRLEVQILLDQKKIDNMAQFGASEEVAQRALEAFRTYAGQDEPGLDDY